MTTTTFNKLIKSNFITINQNMIAEQAIEIMKNSAYDKNSNSILYVVDNNNYLVGILNVNALLVSNLFSKISEIMENDFNFIKQSMLNNPNKLIEIFYKLNAIELPVLNNNNQIVGIITIYSLLNNNKSTFANKEGYVPSAIANVKQSSIFLLYKNRISWLVILIFMNIFSGAGISAFEDIIASSIALIFFLPLLIDSAGNAGSQSATLVIRSLALGTIKLKDWLLLFSKEALVASALGVSMALAVIPLGIWRGGFELALIVGLTMFCVVILGCLIGISLPFIFQKVKLDPATASGPLITSIADIMGVLIYFSIASAIISL